MLLTLRRRLDSPVSAAFADELRALARELAIMVHHVLVTATERRRGELMRSRWRWSREGREFGRRMAATKPR